MQREIEARHRSMRVASYLIQNVPAFKSGKLAICAYELDGLQTTQLAGPSPKWLAQFGESDLVFSDKDQIRSVCRSPASSGQQRTCGVSTKLPDSRMASAIFCAIRLIPR